MRRGTRLAGWCLGLLLAALVQAQPARTFSPDAAPDPQQLEKRLGAVGMLLEKSSAARQLDASTDPRVKERRTQSLERYRQAREAFEAKDYPASAKLLTEASTLAAEAARMSAAKTAGENHKAEFKAKLASAKSLLAAQQRIAEEKKGEASAAHAAETAKSIVSMLAEAEAHESAERMPQAHAELERAYLLAKAAVTTLRGGDTLTRSLNFASKEEEYHYELDRNNTHQMLVTMLLAERRGNAASQEMVKGAVEKAAQLRREAEQAARAGDHAAAVKSMEDATRELVRGIRGLGIFIPG